MNRSTEDHGPQFGRPVKPRASLSEAQKRLWILDKLMGPNAVYNTPRIYRLNGEVNLEALQNSLDTILQRHEVLRTCFRDDSGVPTTEVHATYPVEIRQIDLSAVPDAELNSKVRELESLEIGRPFDLEHGPLFRVTLIRLSEGEHHLIVCKHHIVTDEWSFQLFDSELAELYSAFCQKRPARLPQLTRSYSDYTESREKWMVSQEAQAQLDYWKEHLNGLPVLDFPIDFPRPETLSFQGKVKYLHLSAQVAEQLKTLSRSHGTTPYMTLLAVFHVLLYRYTGQEDIVVGTPVAGRKDLEFENLIGFFVNTLLIRTDLSGNPGFDEFLERVTSVTLNALDNQDIAFDKLVEELQPDRQLNRNPLFQIMFLLQNHDGSNLQMDGLKVEQIMVEKSTSGFDFAFTTIFKPEGLSLRVNYSTELFEDDTIDRMLGHYHRLLEAIIANPSQSISTLPLLTEAEQKRMFVEWNNTAQTFPTDTCVHQLFAAQVKRGPDLVALIHEGKKMTFQELDEASNRLANRLIGEGVVPGDLVGICLEPSFDMVVSIMSVLKAGAAYLPLDPSYPADRLDLIVRNAQVKKIVTETANADSLGEAARLAFLLDREAAVLENQSMADPSVEVGAESLAYVLYTSGSTGVPKGVMVSHRALLNHVLWRIDFTQLGDQDRLLQKTPLSFDVSVWELFGPLLSGAGMVLPRAVAVKDPAYLVNLIADENVSVMSMVPSQLRSLLEIDRFKECRSLRFVNCGGEVLPPDLVEKLFSLSSARFFNGYGPTETTVGVCYWECKRGDKRSPIPIGKPVANTEVYLLDRNQQ
ncbi:MAG: AMP-binding protein, partial [Verrucomicrobiae bacterium]|nr:AMP-binding protein [Verrucomicrobiae bacterium]